MWGTMAHHGCIEVIVLRWWLGSQGYDASLARLRRLPLVRECHWSGEGMEHCVLCLGDLHSGMEDVGCSVQSLWKSMELPGVTTQNLIMGEAQVMESPISGPG